MNAARSLTAADLDGDGDQDLAFGHGRTDAVPSLGLLFNDGEGIFRREEGLNFGERAWSVGVADLDNDGDMDLMAVNNASRVLAMFRNQGGAIFERTETFVYAPEPDSVSLGPVTAADLDLDGDQDVIVGGHSEVMVIWNGTTTSFSEDVDKNGIPDECEAGAFRRGDVNADGRFDASDARALLGLLFLGDPSSVPCERSADSNDSGTINITDVLYLLQYLFLGGPSPVRPFPRCGMDSTRDELTCDSYLPCS